MITHVVDIAGTSFRKMSRVPSRVKREYCLQVVLPSLIRHSEARWTQSSTVDFLGLREATLSYIRSNQKPQAGVGAYSYKPAGPSLLYASCYAGLARHAYGDLDSLSSSERAEWMAHIQAYQCDDGLFRDALINGPMAEEYDWWGWRHLTLHAVMALTALGGIAQKPFRLLDRFQKPGQMAEWVESRNWEKDPSGVSNEIQNYATLLQYARDFQGEQWCDDVLDEMYGWLDGHQDPQTGLWGNRFDTPWHLSLGVQTGYHLWLPYFYDRRTIHHLERIIDSCLATQNRLGGFGVALNSSACEDIDTIDPLARLYFEADYRREDIHNALEKALPRVLANVNPDGGWVFRRHESFEYGHDLMSTPPTESSMFATWFRTLSLAYLGQVLSDRPVTGVDWHLLDCPGLQFWSRDDLKKPSEGIA